MSDHLLDMRRLRQGALVWRFDRLTWEAVLKKLACHGNLWNGRLWAVTAQ